MGSQRRRAHRASSRRSAPAALRSKLTSTSPPRRRLQTTSRAPWVSGMEARRHHNISAAAHRRRPIEVAVTAVGRRAAESPDSLRACKCCKRGAPGRGRQGARVARPARRRKPRGRRADISWARRRRRCNLGGRRLEWRGLHAQTGFRAWEPKPGIGACICRLTVEDRLGRVATTCCTVAGDHQSPPERRRTSCGRHSPSPVASLRARPLLPSAFRTLMAEVTCAAVLRDGRTFTPQDPRSPRPRRTAAGQLYMEDEDHVRAGDRAPAH